MTSLPSFADRSAPSGLGARHGARRARQAIGAVALLSASGLAAAQGRPAPAVVSGLVYTDFYSVRGHHDAGIRSKAGFWTRRIYLTYDRDLSESLSMRLRLEAKDPGDFATTADMEPFVKDAWVRYAASGHRLTLGLIPTPTFERAEEKLGYRPVEKTPLDLFRLGSSRDKGISLQGPLDSHGKLDYGLMLGDGSGTKSSHGDSWALYARLGFQATPELAIDLYADAWRKPSGAHWRTAKAEAFHASRLGRIGVAFAHQSRSNPGSPDTSVHVFSFYGEARVSARVSPFLRMDFLSDAVPDSDKIEFYRMSNAGKPTLVMVGVRLRVADFLEVVPSLTTIGYREGRGGAKPSQDSIARLTFSLKF